MAADAQRLVVILLPPRMTGFPAKLAAGFERCSSAAFRAGSDQLHRVLVLVRKVALNLIDGAGFFQAAIN